ncbi:hypothetical protein QR680_006471 [Steinernema hermaphroditum]|uniref:PLAT domain-containing protein n=1 Tax=Steinernema hermaphroditum TaxID=289476 RepID=A0AA39HX51_9BILA|nr:hypothetical protein QR680_006471 [Steinernema hermaphroditum]
MTMFVSLILLGLLTAADAYFYGQKYYDEKQRDKYFIHVTYKVRTRGAETKDSGSDAFLLFNFGYVNESTNQLIYYYKDSPKRSGYDDPFNSGFVDQYEDLLEGSRYTYVEEGCRLEATTRDEYVACLTRPNILFIEMEPEGDAPGWAPDWFSIDVTVNRNENGVWIEEAKGTSDFYILLTWFEGKSKFYLRASQNKSQTCTVKKGTPEIGKRYKCN